MIDKLFSFGARGDVATDVAAINKAMEIFGPVGDSRDKQGHGSKPVKNDFCPVSDFWSTPWNRADRSPSETTSSANYSHYLIHVPCQYPSIVGSQR